MKKTKDIFISYKRADGEGHAKRLYQLLIDAGYSVFLDTEVLQNGKYAEAIMERIRSTTDFIVIVTPSFSDETAVEWVKKELDQAIEAGCNVIPVYYAEPNTLAESIAYVNDYNGVNARIRDESGVLAQLVGTLLLSNQDISFKDDPQKDDETNLMDYMHRHSTRAFMEVAIGALRDGDVHGSNYSLALLADQSDYDVISCMWVFLFKCNQLISAVPDTAAPHMEFVKILMRMIEDVLAGCAVLTDEGKLDSANRYFPKERKLIQDVIELIASDGLDE